MLAVAHAGDADEGAHKVGLDHACLVHLLGLLDLGWVGRVSVAVAVAVAVRMARRLRSSVVMRCERGSRGRGAGDAGVVMHGGGGGGTFMAIWNLALIFFHPSTCNAHELAQSACSVHAVRMQCASTCSVHAHAVCMHMQCACTCSVHAHAVRMQCATMSPVSIHTLCPYIPCVQWPCSISAAYSCAGFNYAGVQKPTFTPLASTTASSAEPLLSATERMKIRSTSDRRTGRRLRQV